MVCAIVFNALLACARVDFGNLYDLKTSEGLLATLLLANFGGTRAQIGQSWEYLAAPGMRARYYSRAVVFQDAVWMLGGRGVGGMRFTDAAVSADGVSFASVGGAVPNDAAVFGAPAAVAFDGLLVYAVASIENNGDSRLRIYSSADGLIYTQRYAYTHPQSNIRQSPELVVYRGQIYAYCYGRVFESTDGLIWTDAGAMQPPGIGGLNGEGNSPGFAVFQDRILVNRDLRSGIPFFGNQNGPVRVSTDGVNFSSTGTQIINGEFAAHLVFDDRYFSVQVLTLVLSRTTGGIRETYDLRTWPIPSGLNTACCRLDLFGTRRDYAAVVFRNRMRFYGGRSIDNLEVYGDAWFSLGGGSGRDGGTHTDFSK